MKNNKKGWSIPINFADESMNMDVDTIQQKLRQEYVNTLSSNTDSLGTVDDSILERLDIAIASGDIETAVALKKQIRTILGYEDTEKIADKYKLNDSNLKSDWGSSFYNEESFNFDSGGCQSGLWNGNSLDAHIAKADSQINTDSGDNDFYQRQKELRQARIEMM